MNAQLPEPLLAYFVERETQRAAAVESFLASLTDYERGLFHDAAVMGYVQGLMRDRAEGCPKDSQVMALVVDACFAHSDLYPTVNADFEERRAQVEYFLQCQQSDGTWEQASSSETNPHHAVQRLARMREQRAEFTWRLARRTTTVTVQTQKEERR
ncbi:hypothetical protein ABZX74_15415 [Streptomyces olivaceoviridis]|uniref:hypothetical protein n=1 Tax=Streptomyces olivaceoviridis TaxID=1921 RepID=UPI0033AA5A2A